MNRVKDAIRGRLANLLDRQLSEKTKRLMFLASFLAQLKDPREIDNAMLHKLNHMFTLASDDAALKFPVHLSHAIWRNRPLEPGIRSTLRSVYMHERALAVGKKVIEAMPKWMRYDDEAKMLKDTVQLLRNWQQVENPRVPVVLMQV